MSEDGMHACWLREIWHRDHADPRLRIAIVHWIMGTLHQHREDDLGPWLAEQWGLLANIDPDLLGQIEA